MVIVWGKKIRRIPCGWAMAFCPVCRAERAMSAVVVRSVGHLYFVRWAKAGPS